LSRSVTHDSLEAESEAFKRASDELARGIMRGHLQDFVRKNGKDASFESWIALMHPENVTIDRRLSLPESEHLIIWNELQGNRRPSRSGAGVQLDAVSADDSPASPPSSRTSSPQIAARLQRARMGQSRGRVVDAMQLPPPICQVLDSGLEAAQTCVARADPPAASNVALDEAIPRALGQAGVGEIHCRM
jgi:hypothetical protein